MNAIKLKQKCKKKKIKLIIDSIEPSPPRKKKKRK